MPKTFQIAVIGPTGVGKSQFCNYVQKDLTNSKNKVDDSLDSCTKNPSSNIFDRQNATFNFIDTAGNSDSDNDDEKNLEILINYLKGIEKIDCIFLLLSFGERFSQNSKDYIKKLGKIFTPLEFYNHLTIVFTKSGDQNKLIKKKEKNKAEVIKILKECFSLEGTVIGKIPDVYFIDTQFDEDTQTFNLNSQDTIDIMLKKLVLDSQIYKYKPINTSNLDTTGQNKKLREENEKKEFEILINKCKELELQKENDEKIKNQLEEEIKKNKRNEEERKRKEKELNELKQRQEEEKRRLEEKNRQMEKERLELLKKQQALYEEARKKKINIDKLDGIIDGCGKAAKMSGIEAAAGVLLLIGGAALTIVCPVVGPIVASFGVGIIGGGAVTGAGAGVVAAGAKIKKEIDS